MKSAFLIAACIFIIAVQSEGSVTQGMKVNPRPKQPHTSFQTPSGYVPEHDIRTDAVIVYSCDKQRTDSWQDKGYVVQTMYGFRTGDDYIKSHADEGQTNAEGVILTCGPGSYYMVPTQSRIDAAVSYYREAVKNGTGMAVPEEPEFFIQAGYSESFKREWQAYYNEPWQDQTSSIEARWKSSRLKGFLEYRMVKSILEDARKQNPDVVRAVAAHSPVSYYLWGIIYPHYEVMKLPELQEMIAQVWTGTARSACRYEGEMAERTFENAYLEYSSLYNLMRGTGKRVWFLMDPLEDNPDRTMEDYQTNYEKTLVASLMFPEVDEFEVMPWPSRIFGRVPDEFATKIMTIVTMLGDVHNQKDSELDAGTQGIATFVADSMAWQRGEPHASDFDSFYGLTLPLITKGIPVQVAQLERTPEPKYLDQCKVLLLSYDIMKPMDAAYNEALAEWVKKGGVLILFGGSDAYNDLPEWWQKAGFRSPQDHLLGQVGVSSKDSISLTGKDRKLGKITANSLTRVFPKLIVPAADEITAYDLDGRPQRDRPYDPPGTVGEALSGLPLYSLGGTELSPFFEKKIGKGTLIFCGIAPKYFASSKESADLLRAITAYGCEKAGVRYREQHFMKIRRGRYVAVRAFDKPVRLKGTFVDVLDPGIRLVANPEIPAGDLAVMADVGKLIADSKPRVLLSSNRIEASSETASSTKLLLSGLLKTKGIVRISTAGRQVKSVTAEGTSGKPVPFDQKLESGTLAMTYDGLPEGVLVKVGWK